jgi:hypothetical protein
MSCQISAYAAAENHIFYPPSLFTVRGHGIGAQSFDLRYGGELCPARPETKGAQLTTALGKRKRDVRIYG